LEAICLKAMALNPVERYAKPTALADDLEHWLADEPVTAYAEPLMGRVRRWGRRHRAIATGAAALLATSAVALAVGLAVLSGKQAEIVRERNIAVAARDDADRASQTAQQAAAKAERASQDALQAAARADARYFIQSDEEVPALARATEAYKLEGTFEDGLLLNDCIKGSREHWALAAEIKSQNDSVPLCATFTTADGKDVLLAASANQIDEYDARTGKLLATAPTRETATRLIAPRIPGEGKVIAQLDNSLVSFSLPELKQQGERNFEAGITEVSAGEQQLAVLERKGMLRIVDFEKLQDVASKDFSRDFPGGDTPIHCAIAPDGSIVAIPGRVQWKPGALWKVSSGDVIPANLKTTRPLVFADNQLVVSWYSPSANGQVNDRLVFMDTSSTPPKTVEYAITGLDTKDTLEIQAWAIKGKDVNVNVGLRGRIGTLWWNTQGYETDRYVNLWPFEQEHVEGLCSMYSKNLLALVQGSRILVFEHRADAGGISGGNFCVNPAHAGVVETGTNFQLVYYPYDMRQKSQRIQLVNPYGEKWYPWAVAVSADDSTVVLLVQQAENFYVGGEFGLTRALVFRPGSWQNAGKPEAWKVQAAFDIDMPPPQSPWDMRTLAISADGSTLAYATQGGVLRYSTAGEKLGRVTGWDTTVCRSSDGTLLAGALDDGRIQWLDVANGKTAEIPSTLKSIQMCFVRDNSGIVVGDKKSLTRYDLKSGDMQWSKPSKLLPLAWPAHGDRFVALQPDDADPSKGVFNARRFDQAELNGNLVLAKTDTSEIVSIAAKYGSLASFA
jgi:WD40 repeat protein